MNTLNIDNIIKLNNIIKEFGVYPIFTGSLALMLLGLKEVKPLHDVDVVTKFSKNEILDSYKKSETNHISQYWIPEMGLDIFKFNNQYMKLPYRLVNLNGVDIACSDPLMIFYFRKAAFKHGLTEEDKNILKSLPNHDLGKLYYL